MDNTLQIESLNVKGLRSSKEKRQSVFEWLNKYRKLDIVFLQETHSDEETKTTS